MTYEAEIDVRALKGLARILEEGTQIFRPRTAFFVSSDDHQAIEDLQGRIEAGENRIIPGPPERVKERQRVPIAQVEMARSSP